jgi:hypothetical protein
MPLLTQTLVKKQGLSSASVATSFPQTRDNDTLIVFLEGLRTSARTQNTTTKVIYEKQEKIYPGHERIRETLSDLNEMGDEPQSVEMR